MYVCMYVCMFVCMYDEVLYMSSRVYIFQAHQLLTGLVPAFVCMCVYMYDDVCTFCMCVYVRMYTKSIDALQIGVPLLLRH